METPRLRSTVAPEREVVNTDSLAGALEHRLYGPDVDPGEVRRGCDFAAEVGLAAVLCRPEHVAIAARRLRGTGTATVSALAFHDPTDPHDPADLAANARQLVDAGASEVVLAISPGAENQRCLHLIAEQLQAVVEAVTPHHRKVRVMLNMDDASKEQISACTELIGSGGASLVQGGSIRTDRATFSQIEAMRSSLPADVLLKWTHPLKSVEMMLVCMALGVNRFNGDPRGLLESARQSLKLAPLVVPIHGVDF